MVIARNAAERRLKSLGYDVEKMELTGKVLSVSTLVSKMLEGAEFSSPEDRTSAFEAATGALIDEEKKFTAVGKFAAGGSAKKKGKADD